MFEVRRNDYDPDCVGTYYFKTAEDVFITIAESILEDLEDNEYDIDDSKSKYWPKIYKAIQSKKWEKLIGPANEYLYECGNGNSYEVCEIDEIEQKSVKLSMQDILSMAEKADKAIKEFKEDE